MSKTVYLFDEVTGQYKGEYLAQQSPLEPNVYITPIHSTDTPPLSAIEGQYNHFDGVKWILKEDTRGVWYRPDSSIVDVAKLSEPIDATWARTEPPKTLAELNAESNAIILAQIAELETQQARPVREIALGDTTYAVSKLQSLNNQIAALRAQLV